MNDDQPYRPEDRRAQQEFSGGQKQRKLDLRVSGGEMASIFGWADMARD